MSQTGGDATVDGGLSVTPVASRKDATPIYEWPVPLDRPGASALPGRKQAVDAGRDLAVSDTQQTAPTPAPRAGRGAIEGPALHPNRPEVDPVVRAEAWREGPQPALDESVLAPVPRMPGESAPTSPVSTVQPALRGTELAAQLAPQIRHLRDGSVDVSLSPAELGHVRLSLVRDGDTILVQVVAERAETLELLRRHADQLGAALRDAGYPDAQCAFSQGRGRGNLPARADTTGPTEVQPHRPDPGLPRGISDDRLDIRL